jgi:hypothetical protein
LVNTNRISDPEKSNTASNKNAAQTNDRPPHDQAPRLSAPYSSIPSGGIMTLPDNKRNVGSVKRKWYPASIAAEKSSTRRSDAWVT